MSDGAVGVLVGEAELVRRMVTEFGMSDKLGSERYAGQQLQYLGGSVEDNSQISPETRQVIDGEVQRFVTAQYKRAQELLKKHNPALKSLVQQLLKFLTVRRIALNKALDNCP